jgi:hypothetical protein
MSNSAAFLQGKVALVTGAAIANGVGVGSATPGRPDQS